MLRVGSSKCTTQFLSPRALPFRRSFFMPPAYPVHPSTLPPYEPPKLEEPGELDCHDDGPVLSPIASQVSGMSVEAPNSDTCRLDLEPRLLLDKHTAAMLLRAASAGDRGLVQVDDPSGLAANSWVGPWLRDLFPGNSLGAIGKTEGYYELRKEDWSSAWTSASDQEPASP
jgi:hypothetical protein